MAISTLLKPAPDHAHDSEFSVKGAHCANCMRKIEAAVPPSETQVADFAQRLSPILRERIKDVDQRRHVWEDLLQSPAAELARTGKVSEAVEQAIAAIGQPRQTQGVVHLVGAGPGDPVASRADLRARIRVRILRRERTLRSYDKFALIFRKRRLIAENAALYLAPLLPPHTVNA